MENTENAPGSEAAFRTGVVADLTDSELRDLLADRERYEVRSAPRALVIERDSEVALSAESLRSKISDRAYDLIVDFETGGRAYYESPRGINSRPVWPGGSSGVTIGCGYDLGFNDRADFLHAWGEVLADRDVTLLAGSLGLKGLAAKRFLPRVTHITIAWGIALSVFDRIDLPAEARRVLAHLPEASSLHPHCFGALVSLVFNRGASFALAGDRYREMREIRALVKAGDLEAVPQQIRAMKRLWQNTGQRGLLIRRDKEAQLFQDGLDATRLAQQSPPSRAMLTGPERAGSVEAGAVDPDLDWLEALTQDQRDEVLYGSGGDIDPESVAPWAGAGQESARRYDRSDVRWVANDKNHPDYEHLPPDAKGAAFRFTSDDLETLIKCNRFAPQTSGHNKLIFALRGARLDSGHSLENTAELPLTDVRPDHVNFRCVIGVYDRATRKLSAYTASTVCNAGAVVACYNFYNRFSPKKQGNILPTGCYELCVGTHYGNVTVPGVFRLGDGQGPESSSTHTVLRTGNDVIFGTQDIWDPCKPQDNLHPAFGTSSFSSLGCLTVRGTYSNGHQGQWKQFRAAAGLRSSQDSMGVRYDMVLLTGLDAATACRWRIDNKVQASQLNDALGCLRQGSTGPEVAKLQKRLGLAAQTGVFDWETAERLADAQTRALGWASGNLSPAMDAALGFGVFDAETA